MGKKTKVGKTRKDKFYKLAKETGFRSRSAFKLIQLNRKFGFLQQSQVCIDLCAAPGGWMQVAKQNMPVSSIVVGVDLYPIKAIPGCIGLVEDITTDKCKTSLSRELQTWKADVVLHDGAPNVGKNWLFDAYQQICLTLQSLKLATNFLRSNGWFVTKVFRSKDYNALLWVLKQLFKKVHATKPSASRKESAEIFVVCQGYLAPTKIDPKLLDAKYVFEELELDGQKKSTLLQAIKLKRVKAEGYTDKEMAMRNELSCIEFMENDNGLAALQGISNIIIDHDGVKKHPKTTIEILECCKDIKVLGRKEIKGLLLWHKHVKADLFKKEEEKVEKIVEKVKEDLTPDEIEELEMEKLDKQIADLVSEEQRDAKRKKKKVLKEKTKLNERMNLKMVIKGDHGPREEGEDGVFDLKEIKTGEDLDDLQDVAPDHVAETTEINGTFIPKYKKYDKDVIPLDEDGLYEDKNFKESDYESSEASDFDRDGLGLSDKEDDDDNTKTNKSKNKKKKTDHPLIRSGDYRDKDTKRQQRVQLWYEKDNLQQMESDDDDEEYDLDKLAKEYQTKGVEVLGLNKTTTKDNKIKPITDNKKKPITDKQNKTTISAGEKAFFSNDNDIKVIGKKAKRKARHDNDNKSSSSSESSDTDDNDEDNDNKVADKGLNGSADKVKKIRLNESELAIGAMMIKGKKTKRDLIDSAWNRYVFNDNNLPEWFVQDEDLHMRKPVPVPPELLDEYNNKVLELNVRPIKKVMEAKARKKRRATKRMEKAKKKAEQIMEHSDGTAQDKMRQIRKLYKKAEDKKKEISYVVARKHLSGKRVRRPPGVKGRFRVVDPRQKKDKRSVAAKEKKNKKGKRK